MENFGYYVPTKIIFGRGEQHCVGALIKSYGFKKVLLHYGGGSIKKIGLYDEVVCSLNSAGVAFCELGGAEPNPKLSLVLKGAEFCRENGIDFILAVGGGSAMDSAKMMALGAANGGNPWRFTAGEAKPTCSLPVGVILTISASGSEMSTSAVITNEELGLKRGLNSDFNRPLFAICNPELTFSVSPYQTACGAVDIMMHTMERYFSGTRDTDLTDRLCEGLLKSVIAAGTAAIACPDDYEARATLMWASSLSHNGLMGTGRASCFINHYIEHDISGIYDFVSHGAGLAVVWPAWAKFVHSNSLDVFCRYAVRVWDCVLDEEYPEKTALEGIEKTERFFESLGMPVRLSQLEIGDENFDLIADKCTKGDTKVWQSLIPIGKKEVLDILSLCR